MYASVTPVFFKRVAENIPESALNSILQVAAMARAKDVALVGFSGWPGGDDPHISHYDKATAASLLWQPEIRKCWLYAVYGEYDSSSDVWRLDMNSEFDDSISMELQSTQFPLDESHAIGLENVALQCCESMSCDGGFFDYSGWGIRRESRWIGCEGFVYAKKMWKRIYASGMSEIHGFRDDSLKTVMRRVQEDFRAPVVVLDVESVISEFMTSMAVRIEEMLGYKVVI